MLPLFELWIRNKKIYNATNLENSLWRLVYLFDFIYLLRRERCCKNERVTLHLSLLNKKSIELHLWLTFWPWSPATNKPCGYWFIFPSGRLILNLFFVWVFIFFHKVCEASYILCTDVFQVHTYVWPIHTSNSLVVSYIILNLYKK